MGGNPFNFTESLTVEWYAEEGGEWCYLMTMSLTAAEVQQEGVYIIFNLNSLRYPVLYVGRGNFEERFRAHRNAGRFRPYAAPADIRVTWAVVSENQQAGVEWFLATRLNPVIGEHDQVTPISVNLPFAV
jgi:hypothetical protein